MTIEEQNAVLERLIQERNELRRELAAIDAGIKPYVETICRLGGELTHNKSGALQTLDALPVDKLKALLSDHVRASSQLQEHFRKILAMGG